MLKALIKKQLLETLSPLLKGIKRKKSKTVSGTAIILIIYSLLMLSMGVMFGYFAYFLLPIAKIGMQWLYFSIMIMCSFILGIIGTVFSTYSSVYKAKDNDLLLSMPIRTPSILFVRILGVWFWSAIYEALILIPAAIVYWINISVGFKEILGSVLLFILLSLLVTVFSCVLGYAVAVISEKFKNKTPITVLISLLFLVLYYLIYFNANEILTSITSNAESVGKKVKGFAYPIYLLGKTGAGDFLSALYATLIIGGAFALVYYILARNFLKLVTTNKGNRKIIYKEKEATARKLSTALLVKELKRLTSSANYILNCYLGALFLPVAGVVMIINKDTFITNLSPMFPNNVTEGIVLFSCALSCCFASMIYISAPSISLEGKTLWILKSLPVPAIEVLKAKLKLHFILAEVAVILYDICIIIAFRPGVALSVATILISTVFVVLFDILGLSANLKFPRFDWVNETQPIKRSVSVFIVMFGGWITTILLAVLYYFLRNIFTPVAFLYTTTGVMAFITALLFLWLYKRGSKIFEKL